ncbi:ThuA domain-containing protein [Pseudactinotalea sp. Z1732]|uniref:ThuA domain-containing protein n=1 Tax=Pseudactinotalea sp. Z1732 TaxID=3413026 RepID=UPI003C7D3950
MTDPRTLPDFDSSRARHALVVRGGWDGHQPIEATEEFIPFLREHGFEVQVHESPEPYADADLMAGIDLIMQCNTMNTITDGQFTGLRAAIEAGTGFGGWHGGIADSYRNNSDYLHLVGGQFATHPGKAPEERRGHMDDNYVPHTIEITGAGRNHPITAGISDFDLVTEQYWVLADDYNDVLATTTQKVRPWDPWHREVTSPAVWTRLWGAGRIFVCTPGHRVDILRDDNVGTIVRRGLLWASR